MSSPSSTTKNNQLVELKRKLKEMEDRMKVVEEKNSSHEKRIEELESEIIITKKVNEELVKELDRVDTYSRRSNIIMKKIYVNDNENQVALEKKVKKIIAEDMEAPEAVNDIDKLHRIGKVKTLPNGKKQQNVIVRFKSHSARYRVYNARRKLKSIKISPNLNQRRGKLWFDASKFVESYSSSINFVFADIHGNLTLKTLEEHDGKTNFSFDSLDELEQVIAKLGLVPEGI